MAFDSNGDIQDVLIIGGGPAGSTAGTYLARQGHRVTILEKEKFPRDHVGESLLPFCYKLLEDLGVLEQMKAMFVRKPGVRFVDTNGVLHTTWCFSHVIHDETYLSFQVARTEFDTLLLNNARTKGATVLEETRVERINLDGPDGTVELQAVGPDGQRKTYRGRFLLDCSGRNAVVASQKGQKKKFPDLDRTALWTHWTDGKIAGGLEEGLSLIVYVGGEKKGWIWVFPLAKDRLTVGVVLNNDYIRSEKAKLQAEGAEDWLMALYHQELSYSSFVTDLLENASILQPLTVEGNYSYFTESKYGENYALVGDAAQFIDPIFSSGIFLAMNSSRLVTEAVHARLTGSKEEADTAFETVYGKINGAYKLIHKLINTFYSSDVINFAQMESAQELIHEQHRDAMAVGHFMLAGDFFDRYDQYGDVIDVLQKPHLFKAYKRMVLERQDWQGKTCGHDDSVFPQVPAVAVEAGD